MKVFYLIKNVNDYSENDLIKLYNSLPAWRKEKVDLLKNESEKKLSLVSYDALFDLSKKEGLNINFAEVSFNKYGKPYLSENNWYFSLSHSIECVLVCISDHEIGCDIQYKRDVNLDLMKRNLTNAENQYLMSSADPSAAFNQIWAIKESYLKAIGIGLYMPLNSFSVCKNNVINLSDDKYSIYRYDVISNYYYSIVVKK